nr:type IV secretion system DNA-binding domain-containing protein [Stakelama pacifica]
MLLSCALGGATTSYVLRAPGDAEAISTYMLAETKVALLGGLVRDPVLRIEDGGQGYNALARAVIAHPYYHRAVDTTLAHAMAGGGLGLAGWLAGLLLLRKVMARRRAQALQDRIIGGTVVTTEAALAKRLRAEAGPYTLTIASVPIPARLETRHIAMIGTTGSGKTTVLRQMLDRIEGRGEAALVYDTSGEFIENYYNPARGDVILNSFDARCAFWSPFAEIGHPADADRIATQLVPQTGDHDHDVWLQTTRILVANMLRDLSQRGNPTLTGLLTMLQMSSKEELRERLAHTSSARTFADDADRATGSVLFMLAKTANLIQFLRAEESGAEPFAFRTYFRNLDQRNGPKPWIFVPRKEDYFEASKPLLACWLECAASAVLGLSPSGSRRVWFILDELADLPRVDNLARLLPEGRKFGAAVVLTFQAIGQMSHRYGPQIAEAMLGNCNSKLFLQLVDAETREWASETIGTQEVEIATMNHTLPSGTTAGGPSLSRDRQTRPAVLESELRLPPHAGYLLLPDGLPVARIKLTADHIAQRGAPRQPGYIAGDPDATLWKEAARIAPVPPAAPPAGQPSASSAPPPSPAGPAGQGPV